MCSLISVCRALFCAVVACAAGGAAVAAVNFAGVLSGGADGDYNSDGFVDAADYTVWRDNLGGNAALQNDGGLGTPITTAHYDLWVSRFGSVGGSGNTLAFEDPNIWTVTQYDPVPAVGLESTPPGEDSIWFAQNNPEDIVIVLNEERTGLNGTERMGTFSYGGESGDNDFNANITLLLNNSVTLTGMERDGDGNPRAFGARPLRLGREDINPLGSAQGGTTDDAPWGILLHRAGTLQYDPIDVPAGSARMDFSRDKPQAAGALYEISGDAVLNMAGPIRFGDRENGGTRTTPGSVFRVRGSTPSVQVEDFIHESRLGLWDHDNDHQPTGVTRMNLGKFVAEFVLDEDGVAPIEVNDELRLGRTEIDITDGNTEVGYAFLRLKLSEPTDAGSGPLGSGDELVLCRFGRITSLIDLGDPDSEIEMGRFFDPDREGLNSSGTTMLPHAGLWNDGTVRADYAGATYEWTINYFEGPTAPTIELDNTVVLSNLTVTGTPGDLDGNGLLEPADRTLLADTVASPPHIAIAATQNLFDLNADEVVDNLDLAVFDAHFTTAALAAAIPEPATFTLVLLAAVCVAARRRRRSER